MHISSLPGSGMNEHRCVVCNSFAVVLKANQCTPNSAQRSRLPYATQYTLIAAVCRVVCLHFACASNTFAQSVLNLVPACAQCGWSCHGDAVLLIAERACVILVHHTHTTTLHCLENGQAWDFMWVCMTSRIQTEKRRPKVGGRCVVCERARALAIVIQICICD